MNRRYSQNLGKTKRPWQQRILPLFGVFGCLSATFAVVAFAGYAYFRPVRAASNPLVLINQPLNGDQLETGQRVNVQAVARDESKITRLELWVDGQFQHTETSSLPGDISPFPLLTTWFPTSTGAHTLTVRAFNTRGGRAHSEISIDVIEDVDRDADGIPNETDACPDQSGLPEYNGCPTPGDMDNDGVTDPEDACPEEMGLAELAGCPDRDGDGIPDGSDICPDHPAPTESDGCPDTGAGDSDSDLVPDGIDLVEDEPGLPEHGGAPPPGEGADDDADGIPDDEEPAPDPLGDLIPEPDIETEVIPVQVEALDFEVQEDYDSIWCYVRLAGGETERYGPFEPAGAPTGESRHWDIYEVLGGANSVHLMVPDEPLAMEIQCGSDVIHTYVEEDDDGGIPSGGGWGTVYDLGNFRNVHERLVWDGSNHFAVGEGPDGRGFQVKYRICEGACGEMVLPPPVILLGNDIFGNLRLVWHWAGDPASLAGYHLYVNGARVLTLDEDRTSLSDSPYFEPFCGETFEFHLTAYDDLGRESPPSNSQFLEGEPCLRRVRVTFGGFDTEALPDDSGHNVCTHGSVGPLNAMLNVNGHNILFFSYPGGEPDSLHGVCIDPWQRYGMMDLFDECRLRREEIENRDSVMCPDANFLDVELGPGDDLVIYASIAEFDRYYGSPLFVQELILTADEIRDTDGAVIADDYGYIYLHFDVEIVATEP